MTKLRRPAGHLPVNRTANQAMMKTKNATMPISMSTMMCGMARMMRKKIVRRLRPSVSGTKSTRTRGSSPGSANVVANVNGGYSSLRNDA